VAVASEIRLRVRAGMVVSVLVVAALVGFVAVMVILSGVGQTRVDTPGS
jgi:purine-cytosine permease-like protein